MLRLRVSACLNSFDRWPTSIREMSDRLLQNNEDYSSRFVRASGLSSWTFTAGNAIFFAPAIRVLIGAFIFMWCSTGCYICVSIFIAPLVIIYNQDSWVIVYNCRALHSLALRPTQPNPDIIYNQDSWVIVYNRRAPQSLALRPPPQPTLCTLLLNLSPG